jgi:hypothetical protein
LIVVTTHLGVFVEMAVEKDAGNQTVEDAREEKWHQVKHHNVGEEIALKQKQILTRQQQSLSPPIPQQLLT